MDFTPKKEEDLKSFDLIPDGTYDFDVLKASDEVSKASGNEMIKLTLGVYVDGKITKWVFDYLVPSMEAKLRHFCDSTGLLSEYEDGSLEAFYCKGRSGKAKIGVQKGQDGYSDKNIIKDYVCRPAKGLGKAEHATAETTDLEPF